MAGFHSQVQHFCQEVTVFHQFLKCVCLLFAYIPDQHLGWKKYLWSPFLLKWVISPLWPWMLPQRPESSLVNGHLLFMPGLLWTFYFLIELKLLNQDMPWCWEFWINFCNLGNSTYCGFSPPCISDSAVYYPILFAFIIFPFHFLISLYQFSSVQSLSRVWLFVTPWTAACQASLSVTNSRSLSKLMSIELVMSSNHLILCHPLLLLPSILPSIKAFPKSLHFTSSGRRKYWSFRISPSNEYSGLISFKIDWLDLLAVHRTLKSLLQHHSLKASILWCSVFLLFSSHVCTWLVGKP